MKNNKYKSKVKTEKVIKSFNEKINEMDYEERDTYKLNHKGKEVVIDKIIKKLSDEIGDDLMESVYGNRKVNDFDIIEYMIYGGDLPKGDVRHYYEDDNGYVLFNHLVNDYKPINDEEIDKGLDKWKKEFLMDSNKKKKKLILQLNHLNSVINKVEILDDYTPIVDTIYNVLKSEFELRNRTIEGDTITLGLDSDEIGLSSYDLRMSGGDCVEKWMEKLGTTSPNEILKKITEVSKEKLTEELEKINVVKERILEKKKRLDELKTLSDSIDEKGYELVSYNVGNYTDNKLVFGDSEIKNGELV